MSRHREMDAVIRRLRREGFTATIAGCGHWRITHPDLATPVFASSTPSDRRAIHNLLAMARRHMPGQPQTI